MAGTRDDTPENDVASLSDITRGIASYEFAKAMSAAANVRNIIPEFLANYVTRTMDEYRKQVELTPFIRSFDGCLPEAKEMHNAFRTASSWNAVIRAFDMRYGSDDANDCDVMNSSGEIRPKRRRIMMMEIQPEEAAVSIATTSDIKTELFLHYEKVVKAVIDIANNKEQVRHHAASVREVIKVTKLANLVHATVDAMEMLGVEPVIVAVKSLQNVFSTAVPSLTQ